MNISYYAGNILRKSDSVKLIKRYFNHRDKPEGMMVNGLKELKLRKLTSAPFIFRISHWLEWWMLVLDEVKSLGSKVL